MTGIVKFLHMKTDLVIFSEMLIEKNLEDMYMFFGVIPVDLESTVFKPVLLLKSMFLSFIRTRSYLSCIFKRIYYRWSYATRLIIKTKGFFLNKIFI